MFLKWAFRIFALFLLFHPVTESSRTEECDKTKRWILFFPLTIVKCRKDHHGSDRQSGEVFAVTSTNTVQYVQKINNNSNNKKSYNF